MGIGGGALGPIANLVGFTAGGQIPQGQKSTPDIGSFTGLGNFLKTPATGTFFFNDVLFASSSQQVGTDFKAGGFYTGIPPLFGGTGFQGLQPRFDFFANNSNGLFGVDAALALDSLVGRLGLSGLGNSGSSGSTAAPEAGTADKTAKKADDKKADSKKKTPTKAQLDKMSKADLIKLILGQ